MMTEKEKKMRHSVCACAQLRQADRVLTQLYDQYLREADIRTTQFSLLRRIHAAGAISITDIGELMCMAQPTVTRNINNLEKHGYVVIESDKADARRKTVTLSAAGRARLKKAQPLWEKAQEAIKEKLGEKRMNALMWMLNEVIDATADA